MKKITIKSKNSSYDIIIGKNILSKLGLLIFNKLKFCCKIVLITDVLVYKLYGKIVENSLKKAGFLVFVFILQNEEKSKNLKNLTKLYSFLFRRKISKKDLILAFGGGMVGDIAGFCAATYFRGIKLVNVPTTLLAQVDASIGGKNAINLNYGKNLIGTIKEPFLVVSDVFLLKSLSRKVFYSGVSEIIKYAVTFSKKLYLTLVKKEILNFLEEIIVECVKIKRDVVQQDEFEKNVRMKLNFGHTIGHAVEKSCNFEILHGEAVAVGMCYITEKSFKHGITSFADFLRLKFLLRKYFLPTVTDIPFKKIIKNVMADKKIFGNNINFCVIENIGSCKILSYSILKFKKFLEG